jgi:tetratricopeptide (TPR) repeat protein
MSIIASLVAPAAFALMQAKSAEDFRRSDVKSLPTPTPPPILTVPMPVPRAPVAGPCARAGQARVAVDDGSISFCITRIEGRPALVAVAATGQQIGRAAELELPTALAMLADTRLEPLWPEVEAILGEGGAALRDAQLARGREAYRRGRATSLSRTRATMESMNGADSRATLDMARVLDAAGQLDEALALLDAELPQPREGEGRISDERQYDRLSNRLRYAQLLYNNRRHGDALAPLETLENDPLIAPDYRVNATVNRAAFLAELGRGPEALAAIDRAGAVFGSPTDAYRIEGSGRQFAWIRACALHLMGRADESAAAMAVVDSAPERFSGNWATVPTTSSIGFRAALCLGDVNRVADLLGDVGSYGYPYPYATIVQEGWQPSLPTSRQLVAAAVERLRARGVALPVRSLPESYRLALANWQRHVAPAPSASAPAAQP